MSSVSLPSLAIRGSSLPAGRQHRPSRDALPWHALHSLLAAPPAAPLRSPSSSPLLYMFLATFNRSFEEQKQSHAPTWTVSFALYIAFQIFCIVAAAVGNILVCIAICTDKHLRKRSNSLYVSLAVADLLIALFVMTVTTARTLQGTWVFPDFFCEIYLSMDVMCSTASILNICAIAFDRYMHVQDPFNYETRMTRGVFALGILLIWLLSGLISFVPFHLGWHIPFQAGHDSRNSSFPPSLASSPNPDHVCMLDLNFTYAFVSSCISFFIPLIVTLALYGVLYRTAREHAAKIKSAERECSINGDAEHRHHSHWRHRRRIKADNKAQLTLGIIMGLFLACWLPFFIVNIASGACKCITGQWSEEGVFLEANSVFFCKRGRGYRLSSEKNVLTVAGRLRQNAFLPHKFFC